MLSTSLLTNSWIFSTHANKTKRNPNNKRNDKSYGRSGTAGICLTHVGGTVWPGRTIRLFITGFFFFGSKRGVEVQDVALMFLTNCRTTRYFTQDRIHIFCFLISTLRKLKFVSTFRYLLKTLKRMKQKY